MWDSDPLFLSAQNEAEAFFLNRLRTRAEKGLFRKTAGLENGIDFISNDYLSLARKPLPVFPKHLLSGTGASRLVSGETPGLLEFEKDCASFFEAETALFFPNGYMANLALLSTLATRNDTYIYDAHCHVSLKDGMRLSQAKRFSFAHNRPDDLRKKISKASGQVFVIVESIYSMEGDLAPLKEFKQICEETGALLIVDEAHATGILGKGGRGASQLLSQENKPWIRIYTFGKALGASGAVIACTESVRHYLVNYAHPAIYSTAPLPVQVALCHLRLKSLEENEAWVNQLQNRIATWTEHKSGKDISRNPGSPVQYIKVNGNEQGKSLESKLKKEGFLTKLMLPPTVPEGGERIRICLHRHNHCHEIQSLLKVAGDF